MASVLKSCRIVPCKERRVFMSCRAVVLFFFIFFVSCRAMLKLGRSRHVTDKARRVKRVVLIRVVSNRTVSKRVVIIRVLNTVCINMLKTLKIQKIQKNSKIVNKSLYFLKCLRILNYLI
jgi:hypothetical protein